MFRTLIIIGTGGFIGSIARFLISRLNLSVSFYSIPVGTLLVNVLGSLAIGLLMGLSERSVIISTETRLFLMVGICGGFTTFSSFTLENLTLMHNGQILQVIIYSASSIILGFIAVYAGYVISNLF